MKVNAFELIKNGKVDYSIRRMPGGKKIDVNETLRWVSGDQGETIQHVHVKDGLLKVWIGKKKHKKNPKRRYRVRKNYKKYSRRSKQIRRKSRRGKR